jgi:hypothetical protein
MSKYLLTVLLLTSIASFSSAANSAGPPVVVDAQGKIVGTLIGQNRIMRKIGGLMVGMAVSPEGFNTTAAKILFATTDCTGQNYLGTAGLPLTAYTEVEGDGYSGEVTVFYPAGPARIVHVRSFQDTPDGPCTKLLSQAPTRAGIVKSKAFSFTPPLKIQ